MRKRLSILVAAMAIAGCGGDNGSRGTDNTGADLGTGHTADGGGGTGGGGGGGGNHGDGDMGLPPGGDDHSDGGGTGSLGDGGVFTPQPSDMGSVAHAPPGSLAGVTVLGGGTDFRDVSTDEGSGVWAATSGSIYYFHGGATSTYSQADGLAQGKTTWVDNYWCLGDGVPCPYTWNVSFTSVAGGAPGEAVVGNIGYIADRLDVDPTSGAVQTVLGLQVTSTQQSDPSELSEQQAREVASWKVILDMAGTYNGTAYMGGWHGTSAFHNMGTSRTSGICGAGCADYEEHIHGFFNGGTQPGGRDVRALAITNEGDLWMGDADVISFVPQRSVGANADFFQPVAIPGQPTASALDVFPGVTDNTYGLAVDGAGGLYVASYGNGLAYLAPGTYAPSYWSAADKLPQNYLTGVAVEPSGDVWIATATAGVVRYQPSTDSWVYYTTASGLPSNDVRAVYLDKYAPSGRSIYFATDNGIAVYTGP